MMEESDKNKDNFNPSSQNINNQWVKQNEIVDQNTISNDVKNEKNIQPIVDNKTIPANIPNQKISTESKNETSQNTSEEKKVETIEEMQEEMQKKNNPDKKFTEQSEEEKLKQRILEIIKILSNQEWGTNEESLKIISERVSKKEMADMVKNKLAKQSSVDDFCVALSFFGAPAFGIRSVINDERWNYAMNNLEIIKEIVTKDRSLNLIDISNILIGDKFEEKIKNALDLAKSKFDGSYIESDDIDEIIARGSLEKIDEILDKLMKQGIIGAQRIPKIKEQQIQSYLEIALKTGNSESIQKSLSIVEKIIQELKQKNTHITFVRSIEKIYTDYKNKIKF